MTLSSWFKLLTRFAFICHWVTMVTSGENCGINPMKPILTLAKETGEPVSTVLTILRDVHSPFHDALIRDYENYSACVGLMETGYFRKRTSSDVSLLGSSWLSDHQHLDPGVASSQGTAMGIRDLFSRYLEGSIRGGEEEEEENFEDDLIRTPVEKGWRQQLLMPNGGASVAYVPSKLILLKAFRNLISNSNRRHQ